MLNLTLEPWEDDWEEQCSRTLALGCAPTLSRSPTLAVRRRSPTLAVHRCASTLAAHRRSPTLVATRRSQTVTTFAAITHAVIYEMSGTSEDASFAPNPKCHTVLSGTHNKWSGAVATDLPG